MQDNTKSIYMSEIITRKTFMLMANYDFSKNISYNAKNTDIVYSQVFEKMKYLEELGFLNLNKKGRSIYATPTTKGKEAIEIMQKLSILLGDC